MGLFDSIQNIVGDATNAAQGSIGDAVGDIIDTPVVQDLQDQATTLTDGATNTVAEATEQGQTIIEDITSNLGL